MLEAASVRHIVARKCYLYPRSTVLETHREMPIAIIATCDEDKSDYDTFFLLLMFFLLFLRPTYLDLVDAHEKPPPEG